MIPKKTIVPESLAEQISSTLAKEEETQEEQMPKKRNREGQINVLIPTDVKEKWQIMAVKNHINMKQLITFAVEHLSQEIEDEDVVLTIGGVMTKKR